MGSYLDVVKMFNKWFQYLKLNKQSIKLLKSIPAYTYKIAHTKDDLGGES